MNLDIRMAGALDRDVIVRFNVAMAKETEHLSLEPERATQGVESLLADPAKGFYLLAADGGRIAGQLMITYEWSDWRNGVFWWIQSVYVDPEYRRRGVFRALFAHVIELAKATASVCGVRLYVENENHRAQRTYSELGMKRTNYSVFETDFVLGDKR